MEKQHFSLKNWWRLIKKWNNSLLKENCPLFESNPYNHFFEGHTCLYSKQSQFENWFWKIYHRVVNKPWFEGNVCAQSFKIIIERKGEYIKVFNIDNISKNIEIKITTPIIMMPSF